MWESVRIIMSSVHLYKLNPETQEPEFLGQIKDEQLDGLIENLEEEFEPEEAYFINRATLDYLKDAGTDAGLLELLNQALKDSPDGIEISYKLE